MSLLVIGELIRDLMLIVLKIIFKCDFMLCRFEFNMVIVVGIKDWMLFIVMLYKVV